MQASEAPTLVKILHQDMVLTLIETGVTSGLENLSKTPLTKAQQQVLAHRPNFTIVPKVPPVLEYIVAIEKACQQLKQEEAEELRGEIKSIIKKIPPPRPNISKEEHQAIQQLKKDNTRMILTADKGVCLVVMDKKDYMREV